MDNICKYNWIIYLSENWNNNFRRYLLKVLAKQSVNSKMVCIERPVCILTSLFRSPLVWLNKVMGKRTFRKIEDNIYLYKPWIILHDHLAVKLPIIQHLNMVFIKWQITNKMNLINVNKGNLISWIFDPFQEDYVSIMGEKISIYECYDDYMGWDNIPFFRNRSSVSVKEEHILDKVDLTLVVSRSLYDNKYKEGRNIEIVPNGVDYLHFHSSNSIDTEMAYDIRNIKKPVIGYLGNITNRIDFELIMQLAKSHPDWSMVFVGGNGITMQRKKDWKHIRILNGMDNVHFMGHKPYGILPNYLKMFDVCIIPYTPDTKFNIGCSPLKMFEYMATGKPIVSTNIPAVQHFNDIVYIAKDEKEFENMILKAIGENNEAIKKRRLEIAEKNSWASRAGNILGIVNNMLEKI